MFEFRILGSVDLNRDDGTEVHSILSQPKRTVLLAYLATGQAGVRTRTQILELLWGDASDDHARHALNQALYYLRRSLGKDALLREGSQIQLNADVVKCDALQFREALADGRLDEVQELYRGDLLQGFSLPGEGAIERWLDREREWFRSRTLQVLDQLIDDARGQGTLSPARRWSERSLALDPFSEAALRRLLEILESSGERVRALQIYERFADQLGRELEVHPSSETIAIGERIRQHLTGPAQPADSELTGGTAPETPEAVVPMPQPVVPRDADRPSLATRGATFTSRPVRPSAFQLPRSEAAAQHAGRGMKVGAAAALLVLAGLLLVHLLGSQSTRASLTSDQTRIAVFPFSYLGSDRLAYTADGVPELIGILINGLDRISVVDPRVLSSRWNAVQSGLVAPVEPSAIARDLAADHFVLGTVMEAGGRLQVTAHLHRADGRRVATVSERAPGDSGLFELVDQVVHGLVASESFPVSSQLIHSAAVTTTSLPALRHFLRGEQLFRAGWFREAFEAFEEATEIDETFALAHYRAAVASVWNEAKAFDVARSRIRRALEHRDRISDADLILIQAMDAFLDGRLPDAERLYHQVLLRRPDNLEAWFQLGETLFHYGALHGRDVEESAEAWREVLALSPDHRPAMIHLAAIAARQRDFPELERLDERLAQVNQDGTPVPQIRGLRVFATGSAAERHQLLEDLSRQRLGVVRSTASYVARYLQDLEAAAAVVELLTDPRRPVEERTEGHVTLAHLRVARGEYRTARAELERAGLLNPDMARLHAALIAAEPAIPVVVMDAHPHLAESAHPQLRCVDIRPRIPIRAVAPGEENASGTVENPLDLYFRALAPAGIAGGDPRPGAVVLVQGRAYPNQAEGAFSRTLAHILQAEQAAAGGRTAEAREELLAGLRAVNRWLEYLRASPAHALARERFLLAEFLTLEGQDEQAARWYRSIAQNSIGEIAYLAPSLLRLGEIHHRRGEMEAAASAYAAVLKLWDGGDPQFSPVLTEIRSRRQRLVDGMDRPTRPGTLHLHDCLSNAESYMPAPNDADAPAFPS